MTLLLIWPCGVISAQPPGEIEWRRVRPTNTGILGDIVPTMHLDEFDRPWIAAYTPLWEAGGMSRLNADDTWTVLSSDDLAAGIMTSPRFKDIVRDSDNVLWIATKAGLLRYDPAVGIESLERFDQFNTPMPGDQIVDLDIAPDGTIWLAIENLDQNPFGGLVRFTPSTGAWQVWTTANGLPWGTAYPGLDKVSHVAVVPDMPGPGYTVWFCSGFTLGVGTYRNGEWQWLGNPQDPPPGEQVPIHLAGNNAVDDLGNIWIKKINGLHRFALDGSELFAGYPVNASDVAELHALDDGRAVLGTYGADVYVWDESWNWMGDWGGTHTYCFAEDSTGAIWAGGIGGAAYYHNGSWQRYRLTNTGMVGFSMNAICFDEQDNVYMNGNAAPGIGGFTISNADHAGPWTCVNDANYGIGPPWGMPGDDVQALAPRADGHLAVAPNSGGLFDWDGQTFTSWLPNYYNVRRAAEDSLGRLWAGNSGYYIGIALASGPGDWQLFQGQLSGTIASIIADDANPGFVWISAGSGLAYTDGVEWTIYPRGLLGLNQSVVGQMQVAADGMLWVASAQGLFHFDPATHEYTQYTPENSTLLTPMIGSIEIAPDGSLWIANADLINWPYVGGLTHFDGETWTTYTPANSPLMHKQIATVKARLIEGGYEVWVGTATEGINVITISTAAPTPGDIDGDGVVDGADLALLLGVWGPCVNCETPADCPADLDGNCEVTGADVAILLGNWG